MKKIFLCTIVLSFVLASCNKGKYVYKFENVKTISIPTKAPEAAYDFPTMLSVNTIDEHEFAIVKFLEGKSIRFFDLDGKKEAYVLPLDKSGLSEFKFITKDSILLRYFPETYYADSIYVVDIAGNVKQKIGMGISQFNNELQRRNFLTYQPSLINS